MDVILVVIKPLSRHQIKLPTRDALSFVCICVCVCVCVLSLLFFSVCSVGQKLLVKTEPCVKRKTVFNRKAQ